MPEIIGVIQGCMIAIIAMGDQTGVTSLAADLLIHPDPVH
jgi:hypothetical protein